MKCCSRSTLGVTIGGLNVFGCIIFIIYILRILGALSELSAEEKLENDDDLTISVTLLYLLLIYFIFSLVTSVLLVVGITKNRHTLMKPWICSAIVGISFYILRLVVGTFAGLTTGSSFANILADLLVGLLTLGLQMLIFYPIYTLYTDIRDAGNVQEQRGLNQVPQNPPSYGDTEKGVEMYN